MTPDRPLPQFATSLRAIEAGRCLFCVSGKPQPGFCSGRQTWVGEKLQQVHEGRDEDNQQANDHPR